MCEKCEYAVCFRKLNVLIACCTCPKNVINLINAQIQYFSQGFTKGQGAISKPGKKEKKKERKILSRVKQEQCEPGNKITQEHYENSG